MEKSLATGSFYMKQCIHVTVEDADDEWDVNYGRHGANIGTVPSKMLILEHSPPQCFSNNKILILSFILSFS